MCVGVGCENEPTTRIFWPGEEPKDMCDECAGLECDVAAEMGVRLHAETLPDATGDENEVNHE
jgi:hypothetical protein